VLVRQPGDLNRSVAEIIAIRKIRHAREVPSNQLGDFGRTYRRSRRPFLSHSVGRWRSDTELLEAWNDWFGNSSGWTW